MTKKTNHNADIKNPNTGKLFVAAGKHRWKCQQDINFDIQI